MNVSTGWGYEQVMEHVSTPTARAVVLALVAAVAACGSHRPTPTAPAVLEDDSTLGPGDVFEVRVYGEPQLTNTYRAAQDGSIDFPLIGRVEVVGLEGSEVSAQIAARLRDGGFLLDPQVSIFLREANSRRVSVVGAVREPGTFPMTPGLTVVHAISLAGGFSSIASANGTVVTRRVDGELRRFTVPVEDVTEGRAEDFALQSGDIVYVPERVF